LAGGKNDGTICLWDAATGREIRRWQGHRGAVWSLAFSPDGKALASGGGSDEGAANREGKKAEKDATVGLWEVSTGKERARCKGHAEAVRLVRFSPDGTTLASEGADNLIVWDAATGAEKHRLAAPGTDFFDHFAFGFSPDGKTLVWGHGDGGTIRHWDIGAGKEVRRWQTNQRFLADLAFTPDGKALVSGGEWLSVRDVATGTERHAQGGHRTGVCTVRFCPDGQSLASLDESNFLRVWEARTGLPLPVPDGGPCRACRFGFSADGRTLAAVGSDAAVRVWEVSTGRQVVKFQVGTAVTVRAWEDMTDQVPGPLGLMRYPDRCLVFSPGIRTLAAVGEDGHVHVWEVATGKKLARLDARQGRGSSLAFSPGGNILAAVGTDEVLRLWELPGGKEIHRCTDQEGRRILCCFSPDGTMLAWAGGEKIHLWDLAARKDAGRLAGHPARTEWIAFDRGGKTLVSGGRDRTVRVWDLRTRRERRVLTGGDGEFTDMDLCPSPDGRVLVHLSMDPKHGRWSVREAATGREIAAPAGWPFTVSPDGKTFAQWDGEKGTVAFKETATGGTLGQLPAGHRGRAAALAFAPDGKLLASGGADTTVLVWDWEHACGLAAPPPRGAGPRELEGLWEGLASTDSRQAYRAVAALAASGDEAVRFLQGRVRPASDEEARTVRRLLADLDSDEFPVRERATREMEKLGAEAEPALRRAREGPLPLEVRRRVEPWLRSPARTRWSAGMLRRLRAVQALERAGTPAARQALAALARGTPEARLTEEAQAALERLARRPTTAP
jgi:WD40 repeat protein